MPRKKRENKVTHVFICCVLFLLLFVKPVYAQDCHEILEQIKKERNPLKRRKILKDAIRQCPFHPVMSYKYGYCCERLRKYDEALKYYIRASEMDDKYSDAFFGIGDVYMILGNPEAAISAYEKGNKLDPSNRRAQKKLELARIKYKAQKGSNITSDEFVKVMKESKKKTSTENAMDGPILRMQITFQTSSAELTPMAKDKMKIVGEALKNNVLKDVQFEVIGHTDNIGNPEINLELSKKRAKSVVTYLIQEFSIDSERLTIAYFGHTRPIVPNTTPYNRAINRRVEFKRIN